MCIIKRGKKSSTFTFFQIIQMKFTEALNSFLKFMKKKGSSIKTVTKYKNQISKIFKFCNRLDNNRDKIKIKEIEKYIKSQKRSHNTKCTETSQIKSFLKFCNYKKRVETDSRLLVIEKREYKEAHFFTPEEIEKIKIAVRQEDIKFRTAIMLLMSTGARISEVCSITKKQLENALLVNWVYQISVVGKGRKRRAVFIPKSVYKLCAINTKRHNLSNVIWLNSDQIQKQIRKFRAKIKMKMKAHSFRHTYITELGKSWTSLYIIQKLAGHSNINTTAGYLHSCNSELANTVAGMSLGEYI